MSKKKSIHKLRGKALHKLLKGKFADFSQLERDLNTIVYAIRDIYRYLKVRESLG